MSQNHRPAAPAIDLTKKSSLFEVPYYQFLDWCRFYSITMPADAEDVGAYLLELLSYGKSLRAITRAANSILAFYERRRYFIDRILIRKALALAEAQLDPKRVLN
jgi:hypothetical protein